MITFDTKSDLLLATLTENQTVGTKGKFTVNDGEQAAYPIKTPADYGKVPDGDNEFYIANGNVATLSVGQSRFKSGKYDTWNGTEWVRVAADEPVAVIPEKSAGFPYKFQYPSSELEVAEMQSNAENNSLGYGGSTWWTGPVAIGRKENGIDIIYVGSTYGSPEKPNVTKEDFPENPDDPADENLYINNRNGEAISTLTRLELGGTPETTKYSITAFNNPQTSYREDEHFQVAVCENTRLGQIMTAYGSRNSARDSITGVNKRSVTQIAYGQDSNTLCDTVEIDWSSEIDGDQMGYAYILYAGAFGWQFSKAADGDWWSAIGSGGQFRTQAKNKIFENVDKALPPVHNNNPQEQTYLGMAWVDKYDRPDPRDTDYSRLQIFMANHPATMADSNLYHTRGDFIPADSGGGVFSGGGIFLKSMTTGLPIFGTNGKLNDEPFNKNIMDLAYTPPAGKAARLLDTAYTDTPRALVGVFDKPADGVNNMPYGTTWDLVYVYWNGAAWTSLTIKAGIRGALGYDPTATTNDNGTQLNGKEGFVSGYLTGASFWRGKDWNDTEANPRIFYCGRDGDDRSKHYLAYQDLNAGWTALSGPEVRLIEDSNKILYRPEMALGGDKRILTYSEADGWSSFNSWVAKIRWLDLTV